MKFTMHNRAITTEPVELDVPEWLTSEWGNVFGVVETASAGMCGTSAKHLLELVERVRNRALAEGHADGYTARNLNLVEAYITGHNDGWGEAREVEEANNKLVPRSWAAETNKGPYRSDTPIADSNKSWEQRSDEERQRFSRGIASTLGIAIDASNKHHEVGVTAIAKEVIGGNQD